MKQQKLTEKQQAILQEINQLVITGQKEIDEFAQQSAKIDDKWQKKAKAKMMR